MEELETALLSLLDKSIQECRNLISQEDDYNSIRYQPTLEKLLSIKQLSTDLLVKIKSSGSDDLDLNWESKDNK